MVAGAVWRVWHGVAAVGLAQGEALPPVRYLRRGKASRLQQLMVGADLLFILFAVCAVGAAVLAVLAHDEANGVAFLALSALNGAGVVAVLGADFLALFAVTGYLFTALVLLMGVALFFRAQAGSQPQTAAPWGRVFALLTVILAAQFAAVLLIDGEFVLSAQAAISTTITDALFGAHGVSLLLAGLVLLSAVIGAAMVAVRPNIAGGDGNDAFDEGLVLKDIDLDEDAAQAPRR